MGCGWLIVGDEVSEGMVGLACFVRRPEGGGPWDVPVDIGETVDFRSMVTPNVVESDV